MIRLLLTMTFAILLGLGTGYFMWGGRVARLTESLSNLTLEYDTLRTELASRPPRGAETAGNAVATAGPGINIGETLGAIRTELASQKLLLEDHGTLLTKISEAHTGDTCKTELKQMRVELERCIADKKDLEAGTVRAAPRQAPVPAPVPAPAPQAPSRSPSFSTPPVPREAAPPPVRDPRYN